MIPHKELNKFSFEINDDDVVSSDGKSESDDTEDTDNDEEATHDHKRKRFNMEEELQQPRKAVGKVSWANSTLKVSTASCF